MSSSKQNQEPLNKSINMICESFSILKLEYESIIDRLKEKLFQKDYQIKKLKEKNTTYKNEIQYLLKRLKAITKTVKDIDIESDDDYEQNNMNHKKIDSKTVSNSFAPNIRKNSINNFNIKNIKKSEFKLQKSSIIPSHKNTNCNDIALNIINKTGGKTDDYDDCKKLEIKKNNRVLKNNNRLIKGKINSFNIGEIEINSRSHSKNLRFKNNRNFDNLLEEEYFKFNTEMSESTKINANVLSKHRTHISFNNEVEGRRTERSNRDYA